MPLPLETEETAQQGSALLGSTLRTAKEALAGQWVPGPSGSLQITAESLESEAAKPLARRPSLAGGWGDPPDLAQREAKTPGKLRDPASRISQAEADRHVGICLGLQCSGA